MEDYEKKTSTPLYQSPAPRHRGRRWLLIGGLVLAFMLALGTGLVLSSLNGTSQASALAQGSTSSSQTLVASQGNFNNSQSLATGPGRGGQGQCESLTVSSVSGNTIVAKSASGSSVTIHTTASTKYTQAGKTATASAIKAGSRINVMGTHNSDGSITATSIDIG